MIFDVLESRLRSELGLTDGVTLFRNYMPAETVEGVMMRIAPPGFPIDEQISDFYKGEIQVITRHTDSLQGANLAFRVQKALTTRSRRMFDATEEHGEGHLDLCIPLGLPVEFPRLDGNTIERSQKFRIVFGVNFI